MGNQEQEMKQEQLHFQECLDIIGRNAVSYTHLTLPTKLEV